MGLARCLTYKYGEDRSLTGLLLAFRVGDGCFFLFTFKFVSSGPCFFMYCMFLPLRNVVHTEYEFFHVHLLNRRCDSHYKLYWYIEVGTQVMVTSHLLL